MCSGCVLTLSPLPVTWPRRSQDDLPENPPSEWQRTNWFRLDSTEGIAWAIYALFALVFRFRLRILSFSGVPRPTGVSAALHRVWVPDTVITLGLSTIHQRVIILTFTRIFSVSIHWFTNKSAINYFKKLKIWWRSGGYNWENEFETIQKDWWMFLSSDSISDVSTN